MTQTGRAHALLLGLAFLVAPPLAAQRSVQIEVAAPAPGGSAIVTATNLFGDPDMRDLVRSGFAVSLHYRLELWRADGFFNARESRQEWEVIVQYDPSAQRYRVVQRAAGKVEDLGSYATLATARAVLERSVRSMLVPEREGVRYYFTLSLDIEALSVSDMAQLERWLRGVRGSTAASAVGTGMRTLVLRLLGGEKKHFDARSGTFTWERAPAP